MKITLNDLNKKKAHTKDIYQFQLLNLQDIDLDNKEITVYTPSNFDYLELLCKNFNLTMIIKYNNYISEYKNGLLTYSKNSNGFEFWKEYDKNNNLIHFKDSNGFEERYKYDENNNLIHYKNSNEFKEWKEYNKNNKLIYYKNSDGHEESYKYDENNNLIHRKNTSGYEEIYKYNENNELIFIDMPSVKFNENDMK